MPKKQTVEERVKKLLKKLHKRKGVTHKRRKTKQPRKVFGEDQLMGRLRGAELNQMEAKARASRFTAKQQARAGQRSRVASMMDHPSTEAFNPANRALDDLWRQPANQPNWNLPSQTRVNANPIIAAAGGVAPNPRPLLQKEGRPTAFEEGEGKPVGRSTSRVRAKPVYHTRSKRAVNKPEHFASSEEHEQHLRKPRPEMFDLRPVSLPSKEAAEQVSTKEEPPYESQSLKHAGEESRRHTYTSRGAPEGHIVSSSIARAARAIATTDSD